MKYPIEEDVGSCHSRGESFQINCRDSCDLSTCSSLTLDFSVVSLPQATSLPRDDTRTSDNKSAIVFDLESLDSLMSLPQETWLPRDDIRTSNSELCFFQSNAAIVFDLESSDGDFTYETIASNDDDSSSSSGSDCWCESLAGSQSHHRPTAFDGQGHPLVNAGSKHCKNSVSNHTSGAIVHDLEHYDSSEHSSKHSSLAESIISGAPSTDDDVEDASESEESESEQLFYYEQSYSGSTFKQQCDESDSESTRSISDSFDDIRFRPAASARSLKRIRVSSNLKKLDEHMNSLFGKVINAADVKEPSRSGRSPRRTSSLVEIRSKAQSSRQKLQQVFGVLCLSPLRTKSFSPTISHRKTVVNKS
jgi:hypothetical protein